MTVLNKYEQQFNFIYPELYHQLHNDGMLEYGTAGPGWFANTFAAIKKAPPLLLFSPGYEFISVEDLGDLIRSFASNDPYWNVDPALQLVPFAGDGVGDIYCFYFQQQSASGVPIVLLAHDSDEVTIKAKNLQDFIFKRLLETAHDMPSGCLLRSGSIEENIAAMLRTHRKYLSQQQGTIVDEIFSRPFVNNLITPVELESFLKDFVGEEKIFERNRP